METTIKNGTLETIGYTEPEAAQRIEAFLMRERSRLIDIRTMPRCSWNPQWNKATLQKQYGSSYVHIREFGNVNYNQPDQPIQLLDPVKYAIAVASALRLGNSFLLLCACKNYERCHRKTVFHLIKDALVQVEQAEKERLQVLLAQPRMALVEARGAMMGALADGRVMCTTVENFVAGLTFMPSEYLNNPEHWLARVDGTNVWIETREVQ